jgi:hypothetical protein
VLLSPAPACAQFGGMNMGTGAMEETITKRSVEAYAKILNLDKDQHEVAMTLLEGNQTELHAAQKKRDEAMQAIREKAQETQDYSVFQKEIPKITKDYTDKVRGLEKGFFDDLKAACTEAQLANWPKVERYHRRETGLRFAFVSGAAINLIQVVDRSRATPKDQLQPVLDQYELDIDKNLLALEKLGLEAQDNMSKGDGAMFDMSRWETMLKKFYDVSKDIRDQNRDYARKLSEVMDDASKARFDAEFKRRSFPRVYKPAHVVTLMDTALGFPDLDKSAKETIAGMKDSYEHAAAAANEKWAKAIEDREEKAGGSLMVMFKSMQAMQGGNSNDLNKDVNDARLARKELDAKTKDRLTALLSEDQKTKLPDAPREDGNPWADFMPNSDEESQ